MANPTMTLIGSPIVVGSGGASSVTFSSIPATYTDLIVKFSGRSANSATQDYVSLQFNGSSGGTAYSDKRLEGTGSSAISEQDTATDRIYLAWVLPAANATANTFGNVELYIPNYAGSTYKSVSIDGVPENNTTAITYTTLAAGLWANTSAITSLTLASGNANFVQYSTFYLYGISSS